MSNFFKQIKKTVDATIPDKEELTHGLHPIIDYILLVLRNFFVAVAVVLFVLSFFIPQYYSLFKSIGYFFGAGAYLFECLAVTDCFKTKIPHTEMFMVYCFGPLYLLMGIGYIFLH